MPSGIQVFDANGRAILDTNDSITRIVGTVAISKGSSGSVAIPTDQGRPFYRLISRGATGYTALPNVSVNNGSISWNYNGVNLNLANDAFLVYGLY